MIKAIDMALKQWAQELHSDEVAAGYSGGNMVAMMMESNGQLIRGRRAFRAPLEGSLDIELIVTKHLDPLHVQIVREHYCNQDSDMRLKYAHCGCGRDTYYQRLHDAHLCLYWLLMGVAA